MLHDLPTPTLIAVATGVVGAAWSSGVIAGLSIIGCPAAHGLPQNSASVWAGLYKYGIAIMPKVAAVVASSYLYAAYAPKVQDDSSKSRQGYLVAAALAVAIVPYTIVTMRPTNNLLLAIATGSKQHGPEEVARLINRWALLNFGRSILPLASAVVGTLTFLGTMA